MSQQILNGASAAFALCATVFLMIGCIGHSDDHAVVKNTSWISVDENNVKVWFGLAKQIVESSGVTMAISYDSDNCGDSYCDQCQTDGQTTISLLVISTIFAAISCGLGGALAASPSGPLQLANLLISFVTAFFSLVGFSVFMGNCYMKIDHNNDVDLEFGPGSILALLGMLMMWVVVVMQFGAIIMGTGSSQQASAAAVPSKI